MQTKIVTVSHWIGIGPQRSSSPGLLKLWVTTQVWGRKREFGVAEQFDLTNQIQTFLQTLHEN